MVIASAEALNRGPTLYIEQHAWRKLKAYVVACPLEINGFALVKRLNKDQLVVESPDDVFITEQEVSAGSAELDPETMARAMALVEGWGRSSELKLQWHSHVNGRAYFSATDMNTIESYGEIGASWMVSLVTNKQGDIMARLDVYGPVRAGITIPVQIYDNDPVLARQVEADITELVRKKPPPPPRRRWPALFGVADSKISEEVDIEAFLAGYDDPDGDESDELDDPQGVDHELLEPAWNEK